MLLFKKSIFILIIFFIISSCGFKPMYQSNMKNLLLDNKISVSDIDSEVGFYLSQNLKFALNDSGGPKKINLITNIKITEKKYAFSTSNQETRAEIIGSIDCKIKNENNEYLFSLTENVSYDISQSTIANKAAEKNAKKRLGALLSEAILTELHHSDLDWAK